MKIIYLSIVLGLVAQIATAQPPQFTFTPNNSSGVFQGQAQIGGISATSADWIAAFDSSGNCVGAAQIIMNNGIAYINLPIYGDDPNTSNIDEGMSIGEFFILKIWDASINIIYDYPNPSTSTQFTQWISTNGTPIPAYNNPMVIYNFTTLPVFTYNGANQIHVLCNGNSTGSIDISVAGGQPPYTFSWSNNANTEDLNNLSAGTYSATITDAINQSITTGNITITAPNPNPTIYDTLYTCDITEIGIVSDTVINQDGCDEITITTKVLFPSFSYTITDDTSVCSYKTIQLNINGGQSYQWSGANFLDNDTIANPIATLDSTKLLVAQITDNNGCTVIDSVLITVYPRPTLNTQNNVTICKNDSEQLLAASSTTNVTFLWMPNLFLDDNTINNPTCTPDSTTVYSVTAMDVYGCHTTEIVIVDVEELPTANLTNETICFGSNTLLNNTGSNNIQYQWSPSHSLNNATIATPTASPEFTTTYYIDMTSTSNLGCVGYDSVTIMIHDTIQPLIIVDSCHILNAYPNENTLTCLWYHSITDSIINTTTNPTYTINGNPQNASATTTEYSGYYVAQIEDENGCTYESNSFYYNINQDTCINNNSSTTKQVFSLDNILISPNPAENFVNITFENTDNSEVTLSLFNSVGQQILKNKLQRKIYHEERINLSNIPTGSYYILLRTADGQKAFKLIIVK